MFVEVFVRHARYMLRTLALPQKSPRGEGKPQQGLRSNRIDWLMSPVRLGDVWLLGARDHVQWVARQIF